MEEFVHNIQIHHEIKPRLTGYMLVEAKHERIHPENILYSGINHFFGGFGRRVSIYSMKNHLLAILLPGKMHKLDRVSFVREGEDFAFIEGTFYDFDLLKSFKSSQEEVEPGLAAEILNTCRNGDLTALKNINGRYSGFAYIAESDSLVIITDRHGANVVYAYDSGTNFVLSNNVFALNKNRFLEIHIDEKSISEILQVEYPLNRNTEFREISVVLPPEISIRNAKNTSFISHYETHDRARNKSNTQYTSYLESTINAFFLKLQEYLNEPIGIFLSKGKDSRLFLPFLEKNVIDYLPFVFREGTGAYDYPFVAEIARLLNKDLHVLDQYEVDQNFAFMASMATTPTLSWFALGSVAQNYTNTALMGLYGDLYSGKISTFRSPGIHSKDDLINKYFSFISKDVEQELLYSVFPSFKIYHSDETFRQLFDDFPSGRQTFEYDYFINNVHRTFRNAQPILLRSKHYINPITPFTEKSIELAYTSLPVSLIKSQQIHSRIAAKEPITNKVRSTAFPVSLKTESKIRPLIRRAVRLNRILNSTFSKAYFKHYNPYVSANQFIPKSEYFIQMLKDKNPLALENRRLLTRLYNTDLYLNLVFHENIENLCNKPLIIHDEIALSKKTS